MTWSMLQYRIRGEKVFGKENLEVVRELKIFIYHSFIIITFIYENCKVNL